MSDPYNAAFPIKPCWLREVFPSRREKQKWKSLMAETNSTKNQRPRKGGYLLFY
jgi:hypothetical protein